MRSIFVYVQTKDILGDLEFFARANRRKIVNMTMAKLEAMFRSAPSEAYVQKLKVGAEENGDDFYKHNWQMEFQQEAIDLFWYQTFLEFQKDQKKRKLSS